MHHDPPCGPQLDLLGLWHPSGRPARRLWLGRAAQGPGDGGGPYLRIFSRLHDSAGEPLSPGFRRTPTTDWLAPLEDGMRRLGRPEPATVVLAVIRVLLMDLDVTGDTARTHRAFTDFLTTIDSAGQP
jgi:hypothetical protein